MVLRHMSIPAAAGVLRSKHVDEEFKLHVYLPEGMVTRNVNIPFWKMKPTAPFSPTPLQRACDSFSEITSHQGGDDF